MPNHDTNYVVVIGDTEKIDRFILEAFTEEGISFDRIVPMPPELRATVSPTTVVETQAEADEINKKHGARAFPVDEKIAAISVEENARRLAEYGANNWYDWAVINWGTKWGAYSQEDQTRHVVDGKDVLRLVFVTAWCAPTPIFQKIEERWEVQVAAVTIDEGGYPPVHYGDTGDYLSTNLAVDFS